MLEHTGKGILLDIEGTTSSISFVYDVMFPFVRRELDAFLKARWDTSPVQQTAWRIARDAGYASLEALVADRAPGKHDDARTRQAIAGEVIRLMDGDVKSTGLKDLQGQIWEAGFESGELKAHLYDDVPLALREWKEAGCDLRIYSSGSTAAQKLFFGHTIHGNLLGYFRGHYDTTIGSKREVTSYQQIAESFGLPGEEILFLSDVVAELDAAHSAKMRVALVIRPGNKPSTSPHPYPVITSFREIAIPAPLI